MVSPVYYLWDLRIGHLTEDTDLVREALDGSANAFEILVESYQGLVIHIVYRMITRIEDREDLCQEVFVRVYENLAGFRFRSKLSTWISKIAYHTCLNHLEKRHELLIDESLPGIESVDELPGACAHPDRVAEQRDVAARLQMEIERLPLPYRTILTLFHIEQMSYAEIGTIMDLPEGTVKSYLYRARSHLKKRLESRYKVEDLLP
jgi:RNA polymerase sigma factor (sigma-70 family)